MASTAQPSEGEPKMVSSPSMSRSSSTNAVSGWDTPSRVPFDDILSGLSLFDALVSIQAHLDLFNRNIKAKSAEIKQRSGDWRVKSADYTTRIKSQSDEWEKKVKDTLQVRIKAAKRLQGELKKYAEVSGEKADDQDIDELVNKIKRRMSQRVRVVTDKWNDATVVSLRERASFLLGVQNVLLTALVLGFHPQWLPFAYTAQALYFLPLRFYLYKKRLWHLFMADFCYAMNVLTLVYLWILPDNVILFEACYGLSHGPLATAIATWRNVLVFHDIDKVTSLFVHIYPPLVFTTLRHYYPNAPERYPALQKLTHLEPWKSIIVCSLIYLVWQLLYYRFVTVARKEKIEKGGRITSFTYLVNDKKGPIGKLLRKISPEKREPSFMAAQFVYTVVTILPPIFLLYESKFWSGFYLWLFFSFSVWNGAAFYLQVLFRRYERQIMSLKAEVDELNRQLSAATSSSLPSGSDLGDPDYLGRGEGSQVSTSPGPASPISSAIGGIPLAAEKDIATFALPEKRTEADAENATRTIANELSITGDAGAGDVGSPDLAAKRATQEGGAENETNDADLSRTESEKSFKTDDDFEVIASRQSEDQATSSGGSSRSSGGSI